MLLTNEVRQKEVLLKIAKVVTDYAV